MVYTFQHMRPRSLLSHTAFLLAGIILSCFAAIAFAWTGPQNTPPNCVAGQTGCDAPINVGTGSQVKNGNLSVNSFAATQNSAFYGSLGVGSSNAPSYPLDVTGTVRASGEMIGTLGSGLGQFRMIAGNYGAFFRNDGANTYLLLTASGDQYGIWNSLRPLYVNDASGAVTIGTSLSYPDGSTQTSANIAYTTAVSNVCNTYASTQANCPAGYVVSGCGYAITKWVSGNNAPDGVYPSGNGCHLQIGGNGNNCFNDYASCIRLQ